MKIYYCGPGKVWNKYFGLLVYLLKINKCSDPCPDTPSNKMEINNLAPINVVVNKVWLEHKKNKYSDPTKFASQPLNQMVGPLAARWPSCKLTVKLLCFMTIRWKSMRRWPIKNKIIRFTMKLGGLVTQAQQFSWQKQLFWKKQNKKKKLLIIDTFRVNSV